MKLLTISEYANEVKISRQSVYNRIAKQQIYVTIIGNKKYVVQCDKEKPLEEIKQIDTSKFKNEIEDLKNQLKIKDEDIKKSNEDLAKIEKLKDGEIEKLKNQVDKIKSELVETENQNELVENQKNRIIELNQKIKNLKKSLDYLRVENDEEIEDLKKENRMYLYFMSGLSILGLIFLTLKYFKVF